MFPFPLPRTHLRIHTHTHTTHTLTRTHTVNPLFQFEKTIVGKVHSYRLFARGAKKKTQAVTAATPAILHTTIMQVHFKVSLGYRLN